MSFAFLSYVPKHKSTGSWGDSAAVVANVVFFLAIIATAYALWNRSSDIRHL